MSEESQRKAHRSLTNTATQQHPSAHKPTPQRFRPETTPQIRELPRSPLLLSSHAVAHHLDDWKPVFRPVAVIALSFYLLFLLYAATNRSGFLFLDLANLMNHEAGHPRFGILGGGAETGFGYTLMVLGGTLLELIVPLLCAVYFFSRRESTGTAFCAFWFFENFLYIGTYMADARASALLLVGSGDSDWKVLFTQWNLMLHDTQIAHATRTLGWLECSPLYPGLRGVLSVSRPPPSMPIH
jgi:hypothetical protein